MPRPYAHARLAPPWHTGCLVALYLSVAITGFALHAVGTPLVVQSTGPSRIVSTYLPLLVVEWGILAYVLFVGRPRGTPSRLGALLGHRATTPGRAFGDVALAIGVFALIVIFERLWAGLTAIGTPRSVVAMLPTSAMERLVWVVVAVSVAFCEEVVFRGYLQSQLSSLTGSVAAGVALQALFFGIAHGEQGVASVVRLAIYGLGLGVLAHCRKSLWPGTLGHAITNLVSGLA